MGIILDIPNDWKPADYSGDGHVTGSDIEVSGLEPGSVNAKLAWEKVYAKAHSQSAINQAKLCGFENAKGWYAGKPILSAAEPGHTPTHDDFILLRDRLVYYKGLEPTVADRIVNKLLEQNVADLTIAKIPGK